MLRRVRHISDLAQVSYVRQKEQLGLGHAVLVARELVGHEPFAVILSDDVVVAERPCIGQLIHAYHETHASTVAVMRVPAADAGRYGVIDPDPDGDDLRASARRSRGGVRSRRPTDLEQREHDRRRHEPSRRTRETEEAATCSHIGMRL